MELIISNKDRFCNKFLSPITRVGEMAILSIKSNTISSLNKTADNNIILYAESKLENTEDVNLNIPDIKKLIKILECVEGDVVQLKLHNNNIEYKSAKTRFKYHLLEDGIINIPNISIDKINKFTYNTSFEVTSQTFNSLLKSSIFITDSNKVYLYAENGNIYADITDRSRHNVDNYTTILSEKYEGDDINKAIPFSFDVFRLISNLSSNSIKVSVNSEKGIILFEITDSEYKLSYISTAMLC